MDAKACCGCLSRAAGPVNQLRGPHPGNLGCRRETRCSRARASARNLHRPSAGLARACVVPILKSGGYVLRELAAQTDGKTVTVDTGGDFLGYEIAYYTVQGRRGGGVRIEFASAEGTRSGVTASETKSIAPLFQLPRGVRYVRLIYLIRVSQVDHDMAVAAARDIGSLNALTLRVQAKPGEACRDGRDEWCSWVPQGIAVRPEVERNVAGVPTWTPVR